MKLSVGFLGCAVVACSDGIPGDGTDVGTDEGSGGAWVGTGGVTSGVGGGFATGGLSTGGFPNGVGGSATGGVSGTGGWPATGGAPSTGGVSNTGGTAPTGGASNTGGAPSTGGAPATGGNAGTGGAPACNQGNSQICNNQTGTHCGYTFEYWKDSGSGCLTNAADGFSVNWSNINNLLGRKGVRPGSASDVVTYTADYQPNGNSYLCVYGWSQNPLVEYYIVDSWGTWRPPGSGFMGTVTSDGGTYDIYRTQRVNQPSIEGTKTFYQYWSVRQSKRSSGTITVGNHFNAWAAQGMNMGSLYEVSMTVEGYQSSGQATVHMSID
ncbi:MAG TPA: glycoside hydrolase family 11 protein [Polyangiaceae bacterium]|nr:glycoside hydrolase family 11 protein [Polyangiaceae bacterium]